MHSYCTQLLIYTCMHLLVCACMQLLINTCMHLLVCACMHLLVYTCVHLLVCACMHLLVYTCVHLLICACTQLLVCACTQLLIYTCVHLLVCACMHLLVYTCMQLRFLLVTLCRSCLCGTQRAAALLQHLLHAVLPKASGKAEVGGVLQETVRKACLRRLESAIICVGFWFLLLFLCPFPCPRHLEEEEVGGAWHVLRHSPFQKYHNMCPGSDLTYSRLGPRSNFCPKTQQQRGQRCEQ